MGQGAKPQIARAPCPIAPSDRASLLRRPVASASPGSNEAARCCTRRRDNAHKIDEREVLYPWHPWFGRVVHVRGVIEKRAGGILHCSMDGGASRRWLELPQWPRTKARARPSFTTARRNASLSTRWRGLGCDATRKVRGVARGRVPGRAGYDAFAVVALRVSALRLSAAIRPSMPWLFRIAANSEWRVATSLIAPSR
jgi:hypothetical protein